MNHNGENNNKGLGSNTTDMTTANRMMDGQQTNNNQEQLLGAGVSGMSGEGGIAGGSGNELQLRNGSLEGSANGTGCDLGNEEEDALTINPLDSL